MNAAMQINPDSKSQNSLANVGVNSPNNLNLPIIPMNNNTNSVRPVFSALQVNTQKRLN